MIFLTLLFVNIYTFVSSIRLSEDINNYEKQIAQLEQQNQDLENQTYKINSLKYAQDLAQSAGFTNTASPIYLNGPNYAFKP